MMHGLNAYDNAPKGTLSSTRLRPRFEFSSEEALSSFGLMLYQYRANQYSLRSRTARDKKLSHLLEVIRTLLFELPPYVQAHYGK